MLSSCPIFWEETTRMNMCKPSGMHLFMHRALRQRKTESISRPDKELGISINFPCLDDVKWERWKRHQNMIHWCGNWRQKILVTKWSNWKFMCINKWNILVDECRALSNLKCKVFITLFHQHQHYYQYSLRGGESSEELTHYNIKLNKKRDTSSSWERYFLVSDPGGLQGVHYVNAMKFTRGMYCEDTQSLSVSQGTFYPCDPWTCASYTLFCSLYQEMWTWSLSPEWRLALCWGLALSSSALFSTMLANACTEFQALAKKCT